MHDRVLIDETRCHKCGAVRGVWERVDFGPDEAERGRNVWEWFERKKCECPPVMLKFNKDFFKKYRSGSER